MDRIKVDLLRAKYDLGAPPERGVFLFTRIFLAMVVVTAITGLAFSWGSVSNQGGAIGFLGTLAHLVGSGDRLLKGEEEDRINFLFLGVGGRGHDGAELADTIIFSSFRPSTNELGMLSIPRDLLVPIPGYDGWRKVNSVNAYGERDQDGQGPVLASSVIGGLLEQEIQYYLKIDFSGFAAFIDGLGGIDVYVEREFTDTQYPILGNEDSDCDGATIISEDETGEPITAPDYSCRFMSLRFSVGWTHMNGDTALAFARSRHGSNGEGSDFSRAARQQKIMMAVKSKLLSGATLLNPARIVKLLDTVGDNVATNLSPWELIRLASFLPNIDDQKIVHHVLNDPSLVSEQILNGMYALLPANDDWHPIQLLAANLFNPDAANVSVEAPQAEPRELGRVEIQNGTAIAGLAFRVSQMIIQSGFEIDSVGNAQTRDYQHTVIYDLTEGQKPAELKALSELLSADISMSAAGWVYTNKVVPTELSVSSEETPSAEGQNVDFLIVLGENTASLVMR